MSNNGIYLKPLSQGIGQNVADHILRLPRINIVVGSIGMGKTAHTFLFAEMLHKHNPKIPVYLHILNESKRYKLRKLLPLWIKLSDKKNTASGRPLYRSFPRGSLIIVEELSGVANSKNLPRNEIAANLMQDLMTVRHRNQFVVGNIQNTANLDKDHFRGGIHLHLKYMNPYALVFERKELFDQFKLAIEQLKRLSALKKMDIRSLVYIQDDTGRNWFQTSLPSFWSYQLSTLWGDNNFNS